MKTLTPRYSPAGDEFLFVELDEEMSLDAFFMGLSITSRLREMALPGVVEICPANASFQVCFDPDQLPLETLTGILERLHREVAAEEAPTLETRIIDIPVLYNDPWTHEVLMRFRERHQTPDTTDLEYAARINGFDSIDAFIRAHAGAPWFVSMIGFVAGLPFMYQMIARERQIQVPKYLRPRTDTPKQTVGYGGCFTAVYSVRGAGGYQMFGITPAPIYDPERKFSHIDDSMVFFRPGDIVMFRSIDRDTYDQLDAQAQAGEFSIVTTPFTFELEAFMADHDAYNATIQQRIMEALDAH
ncbi:5-oxoprolinase subunit B family protein [Phytohalomonas tamaricis]|uniref:5-oxoprolinase subunit B family protein n=1 Tax=Phytohalomonas tamaricis TaxID=2081032 RepID=UPI0021D46B52|nr:carboxyltransferase domain-containing protein [Phytohalomonas tamaricis]